MDLKNNHQCLYQVKKKKNLYACSSVQVRSVVPIENQGNDHGPGGGDTTVEPPNSVEPVPVADRDSSNGVGPVSGDNGGSPYEAWNEWLTDAQPHDPFDTSSTEPPAVEINSGDPKEI